jgi:YihY family inner membrane protein
MNALKKLIAALDRQQQRRPWLAFPIAVWKKFGDDQAGNLAALIAYYGFASLFPLLLVFVTVLNIVLAHDPTLKAKVLDSAFVHFPVIGEQLKSTAEGHTLSGTGIALAIGLILTFLGARGVAAAAQNALNTVWGVPLSRRAGFPWSLLKQLGLILAVGIGLLATTLLSGLAGASASVLGGAAAQVGTVLVSLVLNVLVFWLGFRLAVEREIKARQMLPGAVLSAIVWQILQLFGTYLISHQVSKSSSVYGVFGVVLGLLAWLYLQAQFTLYAVEANVVSVRRLWPRSLAPPPFTPEDLHAFDMYAKIQERRPELDIETRIAAPVRQTGDPQAGEPQTSDPQTGEPQTSDPQTRERQAGEPQTSEPQTSEPQTSEPQTGDPQTGERQAGESQTSEPQTGEPQAGEPHQTGEPGSGTERVSN